MQLCIASYISVHFYTILTATINTINTKLYNYTSTKMYSKIGMCIFNLFIGWLHMIVAIGILLVPCSYGWNYLCQLSDNSEVGTASDVVTW